MFVFQNKRGKLVHFLFFFQIHIKEASKKGAQIVVLPEYALFPPNIPTRESIRPFLEEIPDILFSKVLCDSESHIQPSEDVGDVLIMSKNKHFLFLLLLLLLLLFYF